MISLSAYAQYVYQHSSPATREHLQQTVWGPLGLSSKRSVETDTVPSTQAPRKTARLSHEALYAIPPITTNVRCVGCHINAHLADPLEASSRSAGTSVCPRFACSSYLAAIGLPFCLSVNPREERLTWWPPLCALNTHPSSSPRNTTNTARDGEQSSIPLIVIVDVGAAEAVLRGSDLYAPGIVTTSRPFHVGERATVSFYVERVAGAWDKEQCANTETPHGLACALPSGATLSPELFEPIDMHAGHEDKNHLVGRLRSRSNFLVCIGSGVMCMEWKRIKSQSAHGTALRMEWTPQGQPSRTTLRALLGIAKDKECEPEPRDMLHQLPSPSKSVQVHNERATDVIFLQNYSSMVPVALLVEHLPPDSLRRAWAHNDADQAKIPPLCTVLDACAAPGGKTSLLLSLLQKRADEERSAKAESEGFSELITEPFRVVCCERSRPRQEQLVNLLHHHFPTEPVLPSAPLSQREASAADVSYVKRVVEFHCVDTNKFLKHKLIDTARSSGGNVVSHTDSFDAVLLDPPCTGMGLRPKLMPHMHTIASIQHSSDYQRKLFDSCLRHLRGSPKVPGVLVYSTCTTTLEENEANVLYFLRAYPFLRLARATTATQRALCDLSVVRRYGPLKSSDGKQNSTSPCFCLLQDEITEVQVAKERATDVDGLPSTDPLLLLRFMPRPTDMYDDPSEDSVGFFVAVFLFHGHAGA